MHLSQRQKLQRQVQSLLLETEHNKCGESTQKWFALLRQKQGRDAHPERVWASPVARRSAVKRRLSCLHRSVLPGLCLPLAQYLIPFSTPGLPWAPYPGCARTAQPRWISKWSGRSKNHYGLALSRLLASKEPFCACVGSPLSQKRGSEDPIILYSNRVLPSLSLP